MPHIPPSEIHFAFSRAGGPGGQNVNKVASKATARWSLSNSKILSPGQKARLRARLGYRLVGGDELVITSQAERSQAQNRALAAARLQELVTRALHVPKTELIELLVGLES